MPFTIVRNDIVNMKVDAIVNTANPSPRVGYGVDTAIHQKAGPRLWEARKRIGNIAVGDAALTPGFDLDARYVIHCVGPIWEGGDRGEAALLRRSYDRALALAAAHRLDSVAFPLLSAGSCGFPRDRALEIATEAFRAFLLTHEMQIYLVIFNREVLALSEALFHSVESFIDERYIEEKTMEEYQLSAPPEDPAQRESWLRRMLERRKLRAAQGADRDRREPLRPSRPEPPFTAPLPNVWREEGPEEVGAPLPNLQREESLSAAPPAQSLRDLLDRLDMGFSETLLHLIDQTGEKDSTIYKRANIDRKLFSKIRNNKDYQPSKATAVAFALALELDLEETRDFLARAGYALSHSSKFDIIIEYFLLHGNYDIFEINEVLFQFDQPLLGAAG